MIVILIFFSVVPGLLSPLKDDSLPSAILIIQIKEIGKYSPETNAVFVLTVSWPRCNLIDEKKHGPNSPGRLSANHY